MVLSGLGVAWLLRGGDAAVASMGSAAPDFTVELIDGGTFTLSESRGRPVVVNLWASWCAPCRTEIPEISTYAEAHADVDVVGVAVRDVEADAREFAASIGAAYPLALGTPEVEDAYPSVGLPVTYVIDAEGVVVEIVNGVVDEEMLEDLVS